MFTNLLAHADSDGSVDIHPRAIAEEIGLTVEQVRAALLMLEDVDEESRTPDEQGRRLIRIDEHRSWGWQIVNYMKYRQIKNSEDRREQNREAQKRYRDKQRKQPSAQSAHAEEDAYADADGKANTKAAKTNTLFDPPPAEDGSAQSVAAAKPAKVVKAKAPKDELPTVGTWKAYAQAYGVRYRVEPVRNATVNGQLANLVSRLGAEEAPAVAAFYVRSNNSRYVSAGHSVGMLLTDAEKLRTEWATGKQGTATQAIQADKTQTNFNAFAGLIAEAAAKEHHAEH